MKSNFNIETLYINIESKRNNLVKQNSFSEEELKEIIPLFYLNKDFLIFNKNNFDFDALSNLFRFYEELLRDSFVKDKNNFNINFKLYVLLIETFTSLCYIYTIHKEKRELINPIFQILKESKNILKFSLPLEENKIKILNNLIGEQLYYFSHTQYINTKDRSFDHIFEEYFLNCEQIHHGYELSVLSDFANYPEKEEETEEMVYINNLSFLLLKMIHKLNFSHPDIEYFQNTNFQNILDFYKEVSLQNKNSDFASIDQFEKNLISEFILSAKSIKKNKNHNIFEEKLKILQLNTDEYKELIDMITTQSDMTK